MKTSLIIIGDELLNGKIRDTNASWLARRLANSEFELVSVKFVRDRHDELLQALSMAYAQSDLVLTTGGLGPTKDDRTKSILADFLGVKLLPSQKAEKIVRAQYQRINKSWDGQNGYHLLPEGVLPIDNPQGLAPGLAFINKKKKKVILCAPGVPREFQAMVDEEFLPLLAQEFKVEDQPDRHIIIRTFGVPEEQIFFELCPGLWEKLEAFGEVSSLPQIMGIDIGIRFGNSDRNKTLQDIKDLIRSTPLAPHVWQFGREPIESFILALARKNKFSISVAESCTGGLIANRITNIPGCSDVFLGGFVSYSNALKKRILGVDESTLELHGAVSEQTAMEMAIGARKLSGSDFAIATSGIAGPGGGSKDKPVGTVAIGLATPKGADAKIYRFFGDREKLKERFAEKAFFRLLQSFDNNPF